MKQSVLGPPNYTKIGIVPRNTRINITNQAPGVRPEAWVPSAMCFRRVLPAAADQRQPAQGQQRQRRGLGNAPGVNDDLVQIPLPSGN